VFKFNYHPVEFHPKSTNRNAIMLRNFLSTFIIVLVLILPNLVNAQFCATKLEGIPEFDEEAFQKFQAERRNHARSNERIFVGLTIHIIQEIAGAPDIDIEALYEDIAGVNFAFSNAGIEFFLCGSPRVRQGKPVYTRQEWKRDLNPAYHVPNTINIYYVDEIGSLISSAACGISTFPHRGDAVEDRSIIMRKGCRANGNILAHEIGHFFGLYHTHETFLGQEFVDGSNCESAGDMVCDTPADPDLSETGLNGCTYEGTFADPKGAAYSPSPSNIMSYAPGRCYKKFSQGQYDRMNFFYETTELADLIDNCDFYPDFAISSTETTNNNVISGQVLDLDYTLSNLGVTSPQEVEIIFRIEEVGNPIAFTIHKDTLLIQPGEELSEKNFQIKLPLSFGKGTYTLTAVLDPESTIIERDKRNNFHDLTLTLDNSNLTGNIIFPNPALNTIKLFLRDKINIGNMNVSIADYLGRVYQTDTAYKGNEEFLYEIDVADLAPGIYILTLDYITSGNNQSFVLYKE